MSFENVNSFKKELFSIQLRKLDSGNYTLSEQSHKINFEILSRNAISDLYSLNEQQQLYVLKDFWQDEGIMFSKHEVAKKCVINRNTLTSNSWTSIILFFNSMFNPTIEINHKAFEKTFIVDLEQAIIERLGYIRGFISEIKKRFFEDRFIDFIAFPKKLEQVSHSIKEIENRRTVPNQFYIKQNLYQHLANITDARKRIEYFKKEIESLILKVSTFDNASSRNEALQNAKKNAAILFNVSINQIEDTGYGLMPNKVFNELFEPYRIEYNSTLADRQAKLFWEKTKSDIDEEIIKCKRANIPIHDTIESLFNQYQKSYGRYKYEAERPKFEKICYEKYIKPYLNNLFEINDYNNAGSFIENEGNANSIVKSNLLQKRESIENNFDNVEISEVLSHFQKLVEKQYLTEKNFIEYIELAFDKLDVPQKRFRFNNIEKGKIQNIFYDYFLNVAQPPYGKQKKYAALLGDYFESFSTKNVSSNFSKYYTKPK